MFSKRTEPAAIASQLVFLFTLAAAFLLSCGLGIFYWLVVRHAFEEDNAVLADKISALSADLRAGGPKALDQELKCVRGGEYAVYWVRIVNSAGQSVTETPGMNDLLPPSIFLRTPISTSAAQSPKNYRIGGRLFSLVTMIEEANGQPYTIQVAQDRSTDNQFTKEFGALLAVVLAFGILASTAIAITVTKRGLRPLAEMTHSLERVGPAHRSEEHTSELQSPVHLVCRLLLEKKKLTYALNVLTQSLILSF